jgi:hypothetical protein
MTVVTPPTREKNGEKTKGKKEKRKQSTNIDMQNTIKREIIQNTGKSDERKEGKMGRRSRKKKINTYRAIQTRKKLEK